MQIVESDLCVGFLFIAILENLGFELCCKIVCLTNAFTKRLIQSQKHLRGQTSSDKQQILNLVKPFSQSAEKKFLKYFHETSGIHPALQFLSEISYFYPVTALGFSKIPPFCQINRLSDFPKSKLQHYRQKARTFSSKCENLFDVKAIEEEIQAVHDFWNSKRMILPNLFDTIRQSVYLVGSSAGVGGVPLLNTTKFWATKCSVSLKKCWKTPFSCVLMVLSFKCSWKFTVFHEMNVLFSVKFSVNLAMFREI